MFYYHQNNSKLYSCERVALGLILQVGVFITRKWPISHPFVRLMNVKLNVRGLRHSPI